MISPLTLFPDETVVLPLRYFGNIGYYAVMAAYGRAVVTADALFDKREKAVHRCDITDTHGRVQLTVPVAKPHGIARARWNDVRLSDHGAWWHVHRVALESAFGRTPFFEFYIDRFLPFLSAGVMEMCPTIASLDLALDEVVRSILSIPTEVAATGEGGFLGSMGSTHLSKVAFFDAALFSPRCSAMWHFNVGLTTAPSSPRICGEVSDFAPYYQVRGDRQGFIPNLSILDLIFNLGPEAPLYLKKLYSA